MEMKNLSRRDFLKLALGTTAAGILSSCAPSAATEAPAAAPAEMAGKLAGWGWDPLDMSYKSVVPQFQAKYPNVELDAVNVPWDDIHPKLIAAIEAGSGGPDFAAVEGYLAPQFQGKGIADLTEHMKPYMDKVAAAKFAEVQSDGKIWGVPWELPPGALLYRSDMFEEAGITEIPATWEEFTAELGPKPQKKDSSIYLRWIPPSRPHFTGSGRCFIKLGPDITQKTGPSCSGTKNPSVCCSG